MHPHRLSGILLHPTSLPSLGGIGTFGFDVRTFQANGAPGTCAYSASRRAASRGSISGGTSVSRRQCPTPRSARHGA